MIRVNLYHIMPSGTWAFAYRVPDHKNVVGLVAGLKTLEKAKWAADYMAQSLNLQLEYVA